MYHHAGPDMYECGLYFQSGSGNNNPGCNNSCDFGRSGCNHHQKLRLHTCKPDRQTRDNRHLDKPGRPDPSDRLRFRIVGLLLIKPPGNRSILSVHVYHSGHIPVSLCNSSLDDRHHYCAILKTSFPFSKKKFALFGKVISKDAGGCGVIGVIRSLNARSCTVKKWDTNSSVQH